MKWRNIVRVAVLACAIAACSEPTSVARSERVRVALERWYLTIENRRDATIYFFAIDRGEAALIDWLACTDPPHCRAVRVRSTRIVPHDSIYGWKGKGEVLVYWWELEPTGTGNFRPDSIRAFVVRR
jgi:hypothetical protein